MTTIVFAGGGSGGHLFPGIAVAEELTRRGDGVRCQFVGSDRPIEKQILADAGFEHRALPVSPSSGFLKSPFGATVRNWRAYRSTGAVLTESAPAAVVGLGGFASVPLVVAAWRRGVPIVLLEQNAVLGRANRVLLALADRVCLSFAKTPVPIRHRHKAVLTGNPIRRKIIEAEPTSRERRRCLLILGGSQGATALNEAAVKAFSGLRSELSGWQIVHQTGPRDCESIQAEYARLGIAATVSPFLGNLESIYPQTAFTVSRAGGTSLAELAVQGIPAILVPYPNSIRDHQLRNAEVFTEVGGAVLVSQRQDAEATSDRLAEHLKRFLTEPELRTAMGQAVESLAYPDAAGNVADVIWPQCRGRQQAA